MTSKSKQTLLCVVSAVLALALIFSLIKIRNYKKDIWDLYSLMQIENAFIYTRDIYLKGDRETRENEYILFIQYAYCQGTSRIEDEKWYAVKELLMHLANHVDPDISDERAQYLYERLCDLNLFADMRSGYAGLIVDVDAVKALSEEIENLPPELSDDSQDETQDYNTSEKP